MARGDRDRVVGRAVVDDQPLDLSNPRTSRGRSASVAGSCSASLQQGIWMMSFMRGSSLTRLGRLRAVSQSAGRVPRRTARADTGGSALAQIGRQARWKARRSPGRGGPRSRSAVRARARLEAWAKHASPRSASAALIGYFAFPTYPTYDSFYALLWGRDLLHLHLPDFAVYRGADRAPAGDRLRRAVLASSARAARG